MAPKLLEFYAVDKSANFINTNAKTQTDVLYIEQDTGKHKLGNGERYCDVDYLTPSTDVNVNDDIINSIDALITSKINGLQFEHPIEKKTAFNKDFGNTSDTISPGKHKHDISDVKNIKLPQGINYPDDPSGRDVLYDDGSFKPISIDTSATKGSKRPISSDWAASHEASPSHLTPEQLFKFHNPLSVSGSGLIIKDQVISIVFGRGSRDVCPGEHTHEEYAGIRHSHTQVIPSSRLPSVTKDNAGAVPPTGNPSGKSLHDDGSWKYAQSLTTIPVDKFWIAPCAGQLVFVHVFAKEYKTLNIHMNGNAVASMNTRDAIIPGYYETKKELNIYFKEGDIFETSDNNVQLGIVYQR